MRKPLIILCLLLSLFVLCSCRGDEGEKGNSSPSGTTVIGTADSTAEGRPTGPSQLLTYEAYHALSGEKQQEYFNSFSSVEAFFAWYNEAKAIYEEEQGRVEISGSDINIGDIVGDN